MKKLILSISAVLFIAGCGDGSGGGGPDTVRVADLPDGAYQIVRHIEKTANGTVYFNSESSELFQEYYAHNKMVVPAYSQELYTRKAEYINTGYALAVRNITTGSGSRLPVNDNISITHLPGEYDCYLSGGFYRCESESADLLLAPLSSGTDLGMVFAGYTLPFDNLSVPGTYAAALSTFPGLCGKANALYTSSATNAQVYVNLAGCTSADNETRFSATATVVGDMTAFSMEAVGGQPEARDISFTYKGNTYAGRFYKITNNTYIR